MKRPAPDPGRPMRSPWSRTRTRLLVALPVAALHVVVLGLMLSQPPPVRMPDMPDPLMAALVDPLPPAPPPEIPPSPEPDPSSPAPAVTPAPAPKAAPAASSSPRPSPPVPVPRPRLARLTPPADVEPLAAGTPGSGEPNVILGEAALAGATVAGSGSGGGGGGSGSGSGARCDMVRRLQDALRQDPEVTAAVVESRSALGPDGRAILIWNGDWLKSPGQEGKGLAGVRQAIAMEVAFAPAACKTQRMQGLVVISFSDGPGAARLALGGGDWRWSELLSAKR